MRRLAGLAAALLGAAASVSPPPAAGNSRLPLAIAVEEVLSVGGPDDMTLLQWTGVAADEDGSIYVLDALDCALKKFDDRGRLVRRTGRKGQGPGEFQFPVLLALSGDRLFAADQRRLGIQVFDRDLRFLRTIAAGRLVSALAAAGPGRIAYKPFTPPGGSGLWLVVDETGATVSETVYMAKVETYLADSISLAFDGRGSAYTAYLFADLVEKRDERGRLLWSRTPRGGAPAETKTIQGLKIASAMYWMDAALDPQGRLFLLAGGKTKNPGRDVLVFNSEGALMTTFVLPQVSHCLYIDRRGFLYARADEGVTLKKYRIRYL
ncbi:MAG: hypothetical protein NTZ26_12850 [Candidatus Aminicenantes bacterium]|nr:hypothetical protein [Candidatus Aminicenantes bacterium]